MKGTYTLLDESFQDTSATISLYIRISCLGKCIITEFPCIESIRKSFYDDHKNYEDHEDQEDDETHEDNEKVDKFQSYLSELAKPKEFQNQRQDYTGLLSVLREKFIEKEATDLASNWSCRFVNRLLFRSFESKKFSLGGKKKQIIFELISRIKCRKTQR